MGCSRLANSEQASRQDLYILRASVQRHELTPTQTVSLYRVRKRMGANHPLIQMIPPVENRFVMA